MRLTSRLLGQSPTITQMPITPAISFLRTNTAPACVG